MTNNREDSEQVSSRFQQKAGSLLTGAVVAARSIDRQRWSGIILLLLVLETAVLSIERAQWIAPQPLLSMVLFLSMLATWLIGRAARLHIVLKHAAIILAGSLVTLWQATAVSSFGQGTIYFAIFLVFLVWTIGYIATWYYYRRRNAWVAVILGAVVILVNLSNLPGGYYYFFAIYFVIAIIFIVQNRISGYDYQAGSSPVNRRRGLRYFMAALVGISILAVSVSWIIPVLKAPQLETWIATNTLWSRNIKESNLNFFTYVMAKQPRTTSATKRYLAFGNRWHQKENIHFIVKSDRPSYWQVYVYDEYTSQGWTNSPANTHLMEEKSAWESAGQYLKQDLITSTVETGLKTDILLSAGEYISSDISVFIHESNGEVITVTTPRLLKPGEKYKITSSVSSATAGDLSMAGSNYPEAIIDKYLQLPEGFPDSISNLSANVTENAVTPYEKVMAIDRYLAGFTYEKEIEPPPGDIDGVEYFLTTQKSGFCTYFASAMAVMLRSVDIPARLVVGYLPGEQGRDEGEYILRDNHYHAWPQVYFPGYGWVNVEATPGSASGPVAAETQVPVVSSSGPQQSGQVTVPEWWLIPYWPEAQVEPPSTTASRQIFKPPRWSFADVLGKMIMAIIIAIIVMLFIIGLLLAFRSRFNKWLWKVVRTDHARTAYSRLCRLGYLAKVGPGPQQTPLEYSAVLASEFPAESKAIDGITQSYISTQFGHKDSILNLMEEAEILKARREVYYAMLKRLGFFRKIFGRLL